MVNAALKNVEERRGNLDKMVAVAVDKCSRSSRDALRWAVDHVVDKGQCVILVHVDDLTTSPSLPPYGNNELEIRKEPDERAMDVLCPYICFCLMRQVECEPVVLQHADVAQALMEFISFYRVETFVLGGVTRHWTTRILRGTDVLTKLQKSIPSFCNMYGIHNGKIMKSNSAACPFRPPIRRAVVEETVPIRRAVVEETVSSEPAAPDDEWSAETSVPVSPSVSAPISRISSTTQAEEFSFHEVDFSFIHSERPSTDSSFMSFYKSLQNRGHSSESVSSGHPGVHVPLARAA